MTNPAPRSESPDTPHRLRRGSGRWWLAIRICGRLIADKGTTHTSKARNIAKTMGMTGTARRANGTSRGSNAADSVYRVIRHLKELDLVRREGEQITAIDLAELAAWVADELAEYADYTETAPTEGET
jgi:hypothetical protein